MRLVWCASHGGWVPVVVPPGAPPIGNYARHWYHNFEGEREACLGSRQIVTRISHVRVVIACGI